jgi:hypothetical protein
MFLTSNGYSCIKIKHRRVRFAVKDRYAFEKHAANERSVPRNRLRKTLDTEAKRQKKKNDTCDSAFETEDHAHTRKRYKLYSKAFELRG